MGFPNKTRASGAAESVSLTGYLLLPIQVDLQPLMLIRGKSSPRRPRFSQPGLLRFPAVLLPHVVSPLQHRWCGYLGVGNHPRFHPQSPVTAWSREENPFGIFIAVLLEICGWTARQLLPGPWPLCPTRSLQTYTWPLLSTGNQFWTAHVHRQLLKSANAQVFYIKYESTGT